MSERASPNGPPADRLDAILFPISDPIILDVGAAEGIDTVAYAERYQAAHVIAFEPLLENAQALRRRVAAARIEGRVFVKEVALSRASGRASFWVSGGYPPDWEPIHRHVDGWPYSSSLLRPAVHLKHHAWCTFREAEVETARLDESLASLDIARADYLHMDVQGAELDVLVGARGFLPSLRAIWMEVSAVEMYEHQPLRRDVARFMADAGFFLALDAVEDGVQGDQLWTRRY